jgi:hypothetical protein
MRCHSSTTSLPSSRVDERPELIAEQVDRTQSQAVQEIPDGRGQVRHRALRAGGVGRAVTGQVRRIDAPVMPHFAQHRCEQAARAARVMQANDRHALVETAARRIGGPKMNLTEAAFGVRAADVNDGGLRQRQTVAMLGLDHCGTPLSL